MLAISTGESARDHTHGSPANVICADRIATKGRSYGGSRAMYP